MEEAYKLRLPFDATWAAAERTAAVFGFLRGVGRTVGRDGGSALGLPAALRSRYTQLYRQVFGRRQTGLAAPDGSSLCGGVTPVSGADGSEADEVIFGYVAQVKARVASLIEEGRGLRRELFSGEIVLDEDDV